jgi:uncharacterized membrane protein
MVRVLLIIADAVGIAGIAIIVWGVILMFWRLMRLEYSRIRKGPIYRRREALRHQLGSYLLLGLEFLIAADVVRTVTHPTLADMAILGSIVVIRTVISHFLDREVEAFEICREKENGSDA